MFKTAIGIVIGFIALSLSLRAQNTKKLTVKETATPVVVKNGRLVWQKTGIPAVFFGVNYTAPFAHAYRAIMQKGINPEQAIQQDVYHMARLGLDAFRVHVWDTEISDTAGNLLNNEHLRLFDFLLAETAKRGIKTIITPIAFWGNGWPEPDEQTPGFARKYGKLGCTTNDSAIQAQERYLQQFFEHVNPYTGFTYGHDPSVMAVEINNEPSHGGNPEGVTRYINRMSAAIRATGWQKPLFYNISQSPYYAPAVAAAQVDGYSFQWYPTGLVSYRSLQGNYFPHVNRYRIPYTDTIKAFNQKPLMIYEFDAADVMQPYMYPAMAQSFKQAGFQWATQFAYDPMAIAYANSEYQTHYLNLAYTPAKAISLMIAGKVFRQKMIPDAKTDTSFGSCIISPANHWSIWNEDTVYYNSSHTAAAPVKPSMLRHVAGTGNSPLVQYKGTGAYFLDKIGEGLWRLELMPDAIPLSEPFARASLSKKVTAIGHHMQEMTIAIPELGMAFSVQTLQKGSGYKGQSENGTVALLPGTYLLARNGLVNAAVEKAMQVASDDFVAPKHDDTLALFHKPPAMHWANLSLAISAKVAAPNEAIVWLQPAAGFGQRMLMEARGANVYETVVPQRMLSEGSFGYRIYLQRGNQYKVYPGGYEKSPTAWDYSSTETYQVPLISADAGIPLLLPALQPAIISYPSGGRRGISARTVMTAAGTELWLQASLRNDIRSADFALLQADLEPSLLTQAVQDKILNEMVLTAKSDRPLAVTLIIADKAGNGFSAACQVNKNAQNDYVIPLSQFKADSIMLLPRPYPDFQPLWYKGTKSALPPLNQWERVQVMVKPAADAGPWQLKIAGIRLQHASRQ